MNAKEIIKKLKYLIASNKGFNRKHRDEALRLVDSLSIKKCKEEPTTAEDLEKDVKSWFFNEISSKINVEHTMYYYFQECARRYAKWGAEYAKEELMKEAVEWDYTLEDGRIEFEGDPLPCLNPILNLPYPKFKPEQKVKLIIVKEDTK